MRRMVARTMVLAIAGQLAWLPSAAALGGEGSLPKGRRGGGPGVKIKIDEKATASEAAPGAQTTICQVYHGNPAGGEIYQGPNGEGNYALVKMENKPKPGTKRRRGSSYRLLKVDFKLHAAWPVMVLKIKKRSTLMAHGEPVNGVSIVTFSGPDDGCAQGLASVVTIPMGGPKARSGNVTVGQPVPAGNYKIVPLLRGTALADLGAHRIVEIDPQTLQKRTGAKFGETEIPLMLDEGKSEIYLFDTKEAGALIRRSVISSKDRARINLAPGFKLFQDGGKFGVVGVDGDKNRLVIKELKDWTGAKTESYSITLPEGVMATDASIIANVEKNLAVVIGNSPNVRRSWAKAMLFDYAAGKLLATLSVPEEMFVAEGAISPDGEAAWFVVNRLDGTLAGLTSYNLKAKKWEKIELKKR